jgi:hypothetical protein
MNAQYKKVILALLLATVIGTSCNKNYIDPGKPTDANVFSSPKTMTSVAVGLQRVYSLGRLGSVYNKVVLDAFTTYQYNILNQGNTAEYQLFLGGPAVDGTNTIIAAMWTTSNKVLYDAQQIFDNLDKVVTDKAYASGLLGYTTIWYALALGDMAMYWDHVPAATGQSVTFNDRLDGFTRAIAAIDKAVQAINTTPMSASFLANIPAGVDIVNTLNALKARYSLYLGKYPEALAAANAVNLTIKSTMNFDLQSLNPIFETITSTNNVAAPIDSTMGLFGTMKPDLADKRFPFYISTNATAPILRVAGFGAAAATAFPIYLPGEITLTKAEAYARQSTPDLTNALIELNKVVTKQPASDPFGVGAGLPPIVGPLTQQQTLDLIYKHRSIELYNSGLRMEDTRRFARPNSEKKRNFFPYTFKERDNNPNTPPDPTF